MVDLSNEVRSLSEFNRNIDTLLEQMRASGRPVVLTVGGAPELVVQDAASYQKLLDRVDELEALEGIKRGLEDAANGRVTPLEQFEREFRDQRGLSSPPR